MHHVSDGEYLVDERSFLVDYLLGLQQLSVDAEPVTVDILLPLFIRHVFEQFLQLSPPVEPAAVDEVAKHLAGRLFYGDIVDGLSFFCEFTLDAEHRWQQLERVLDDILFPHIASKLDGGAAVEDIDAVGGHADGVVLEEEQLRRRGVIAEIEVD